MVDADGIKWPARYDPANCPVHVRNELNIPAQPQEVWKHLIRADLWPTWYPNSSHIRFLTGHSPDLAMGARFRWKTFGIDLESSVLEFIAPERLAWDAQGIGIEAYHAWLLRRTADGCHIITEETQRGWLARLQRLLSPNRMHDQHQIWLKALREVTFSGHR